MKYRLYTKVLSQICISIVFFLTALLFPLQSFAADTYTVDFTDSGAGNDINNLGHIAGNFGGPALWRDGQRISLGGLSGNFAFAFGLNDADHVVGSAALANFVQHAFFWSDQTGMKDLTPGLNGYSRANKINNNGQVAGEKFINGKVHAVVWQVAIVGDDVQVQETDLGVFNDSYSGSKALGISEGGQVVGILDTPIAGQSTTGGTPFVWNGGSMELLPTLGFPLNEAVNSNGGGTIVGYTANGTPCCAKAAIWNGGSLQLLPAFGSASNANAVNNEGTIVGTGLVGTRAAFVYKDGQIKNLNDLISNVDPLRIAMDVNALGQILVSADTRMYVISPIGGPGGNPTEPNTKWKPLLDHAEQQYILAQSFGGISVGYYRQVVYIVCAASQSTRTVCDPMKPYYANASSEWADDWIFDVFEGYLNPSTYTFSAASAQEIADQAILVNAHIKNVCKLALSGTPIGQAACDAIPSNDIGALTAGVVHYIGHLQPNFVRATESRLHTVQIPATNKLKSKKDLEAAMLLFKPVFDTIRDQHQQLFDNAVVPGFNENAKTLGVSPIGSAIANYAVPQSAICVREAGFIDAMKSYPGGRIDEKTAKKIYELYEQDSSGKKKSDISALCKKFLSI